MLEKMKKVLSLLLTTAIIVGLSVVGVPASAASPVFEVNFENGWTDNGSGVVSTTQSGMKVLMRSTTGNQGLFSIGTDAQTGKYLRSYGGTVSNPNGNCYTDGALRMISSSVPEGTNQLVDADLKIENDTANSGAQMILYMNGSSATNGDGDNGYKAARIAIYTDKVTLFFHDGNADRQKTITYLEYGLSNIEVGKWFNVKILYEIQSNSKATYQLFVNNVLIACDVDWFSTSHKPFTGIERVCFGKNGTNASVVGLDNLKVSTLTDAEAVELTKTGINKFFENADFSKASKIILPANSMVGFHTSKGNYTDDTFKLTEADRRISYTLSNTNNVSLTQGAYNSTDNTLQK